MKRTQKIDDKQPEDIGDHTIRLWDAEEKLKALALLCEGLKERPSEINNPEHLSGLSFILSDIAKDVRVVARWTMGVYP